MNKIIFLLICSFLAATVLAEPEAYRFSRAIEWNGSGHEEMLSVPLDSPIYAATRDGFPDLRIVDQDGVETPYLLAKAVETRTETRRLPAKSETIALKKTGANGIEISLSLDKKSPAVDGLTVHTPLSNFEHTLQVFGSNDEKNWTLLVRNAEIFDYSRYMPVSNRDIALPPNTFRQFKVLIEQATQTREAELLELTRKLQGDREETRSERIDLQRIPLQIDRIEFWSNHTDVLPDMEIKFDYPVAEFKLAQDEKNQATVIDVNTQREPLTGFRLQTTSRNFHREATVQIPVQHGIDTRMQHIGEATLESVHFQDINREQNALAFPEQRHDRYQIVIRNQDNPPLAIQTITGIGNGYHLVFLPLQGKTYTLRYGSRQAKQPHYDTAPIREFLRRGYKSTPAALGPEESSAPVSESFDFTRLLNSQFFLGAVVMLMVAVLAWSLIRAGKRIDQFPKD